MKLFEDRTEQYFKGFEEITSGCLSGSSLVNSCVRVEIVVEVRHLQERLHCFKNGYTAPFSRFSADGKN